MAFRSRAGPYTPGRTPSSRSWERMRAVGTVSFPVTSMVSTNFDRTHTASRERASPMRKAYRRRNRPRKSGSPRRPSTEISHPARWASFFTRDHQGELVPEGGQA